MSEQLNLFSLAVDHKIQAVAHLKELEFQRALEEIDLAKKIDPYLADLNIITNAITFLEKKLDAFWGAPLVERLVQTWKVMPKAVMEGEISRAGSKFLDPIISSVILREADAGRDFVDSSRLIHKGVCFLAQKKINLAHKVLLDAVTSSNFERADLWGYLGDALYFQHNMEKARAAYLHALIIDPQKLDVLRLAYRPLSRLYNQLLETYLEIDAKDLLLTYGWLSDIFEIPKKDARLTQYAMDLLEQMNQAEEENSDRRYYRFSIDLYLDQSQPPGQIHIEAREQMMDLDRQLFNRYLEKVAAKALCK